MNGKTSQSISISGPITAHKSTIVVGTSEGNIYTRRRRISDESLTRVERAVPNFCGRKSELAKITEAFRNNRIVVITGFVKVGKTELARKYCDKVDSSDHIIWLDSATPDVLEESLDALSKKCAVDSSNRRELYELITKKKSLFVFDDAEDWVVDFLPGKPLRRRVDPHILITSASKFQSSHIVFEKLGLQVTVLELKGFDPVDAVEFLQKSLEPEELSSEDAALLAEKLYYQPHFLFCACKVIIGKNSERSTARSSKRFKGKDFLENIITQVLNQSDLIESVLRRIRLSQHYEDAEDVLNALSYLNKRDIPESLIHLNLPQFQSCRENLEKYFLVGIEDIAVSINPLFQLLNKTKLSAENTEDILKFWRSNIGEDGRDSSALVAAVKWGSLELVEYIIAGKHAVPTVDTLRLAAEVDTIDVLKYLMGNFTPLLVNYGSLMCYAAEKGAIETVKYLIETDPSSSSSDINYLKNKAFWYAVMHGHNNIVKYLVGDKQVDPTTKDKSDENAVHIAAENGHIDIVKYLVGERMVDPTAKNNYDENAVHTAAMHGHIVIVKYLVGERMVDPTAKNDYDENAVHNAARNGHIDIVKYLVGERMVDPTAKDNCGKNAVHNAARNGHIDIVKYLVGESMVDPTAKNGRAENAVHLAASDGHIDIVKYLVGERMVDPTTKNRDGENAVHKAAMNGHIVIVKYLVGERMVDPTAKNKRGENAVHLAAENGHIDIVKYLVGEMMVDPTTKRDGKNAVHIAAKYGHIDIVKYLVGEMMVDPTTKRDGKNAVHIAAKYGHNNIVKYLVGDKRVDPTTKSKSDMNAVHYAAQYGCSLEIVQYLVGEKLVGLHSLHYAAMEGDIDIVKYLVEVKLVDPSTTSGDGKTAVHLAVMGDHFYRSGFPIVKYLVGEKCVDPKVKDENGKRAVDYADADCDEDMVKYLLLCVKRTTFKSLLGVKRTS